MSDAKAILLVNFFGLGALLLFSLWCFFRLDAVDMPLALVGLVMVVFMIVYLTAFLVWNYLTFRDHNWDRYGRNHMRNAVLILLFGVVGPGGLLLLILW